MKSPEEEPVAQDKGALHCIDCGIELPTHAEICPKCGKEGIALPDRWSPTGESARVRVSKFVVEHNESIILVSLTLALFCALGLLINARSATARMIFGDEPGGANIVESYVDSRDEIDVSGVRIEDTAGLDIDIEELRVVAKAAEGSERWDEASDTWALITMAQDATIDDFLALGDSRVKSGNLQGAISTLNRAVVRFPESPEGYLALGETYQISDDLNAAKFQYQMGLDLFPENEMMLSKLNETLKELNLVEGWDNAEVPESDPVIDMESPSEVESNVTITVIEPSGEEPPQFESAAPEEVIEEQELPEVEVIEEEPEPVTLIGPGAVEVEEEPDGEYDGTEVASDVVSRTEVITEIIDFSVNAVEDTVDIILETDIPAEFSSRTATEPDRILLRIENCIIPDASDVLKNVNLNVPLVERVTFVESDEDTKVIILIVYLGDNAGYTIGSSGVTIRISIRRRI